MDFPTFISGILEYHYNTINNTGTDFAKKFQEDFKDYSAKDITDLLDAVYKLKLNPSKTHTKALGLFYSQQRMYNILNTSPVDYFDMYEQNANDMIAKIKKVNDDYVGSNGAVANG